MLVERIKLHNIRSYEDCEIEFPEGSILLSGDIGAGKSSILMALEFALFGLKTEIQSSALLRKGKKQGYVEAEIKIGDKDIIIKRVLKLNSQNRAVQSAGYIIVNNAKEELSTEEMKNRILKLLGYPSELQKKKKSLLYRFTVYTPQEQMKQILFESREERLNTLRKLFGIDRYKRIKNNTSLLLTNLRVRIREESTRSERRDEIENEIKALELKRANLNKTIDIIKNRLNELTTEKDNKEKEIISIKEENKLLEGLKREKGIIETELKEKENYIEEARRSVKNLTDEREKLINEKPEVNENKEEVKEKTESLQKEVNEINKNIAVLKTEESSLLKRKEELDNEINKLEEITKKSDEFAREAERIKTELKEKDDMIKNRDSIELAIKELNQKISENKSKLGNMEKTITTVSSSKKCPLCLQDITEEYKDKIVGEYKSKEELIKEEIRKNEEELSEKEKKLLGVKSLEKESQSLRINLVKIEEKIKGVEEKKSLLNSRRESLSNVNKRINEIRGTNFENELKEKNEKLKKLKEKLNLIIESEKINIKIQEINNQISGLNKRISESSSRINELKLKLESINSRIKEKSVFEDELKKEEEELKKIDEGKRKTEIEFVKQTKEKEFIEKNISDFNKQLKEKEEAAKRLERLKEFKYWIEEYFLGMIDLIEKQVMVNIHSQFDELFQEWFNTLVEEETITARLDEEFSPIVSQNGYEIEVEHLSGGEKTSLALAYRLALNKVINEMTAQIKTKDIIILDEPTDGFSEHQLDKVRDVIKDLDMKQVIIVSHEAKIESFVDRVIRVVKENHVSRVII